MPYAHQIEPDTHVKLKDYDPNEHSKLSKEQGQAAFAALQTQLNALQEELYAAGQQSVLVVLQGMDTSGKDGAIRSVFADVDPQGCRVESFKVPSEDELAHDFLWRVHRVTPSKGQISVFNRSHYEDVLVVRVHELVAEKRWKARYEQINAFERILTQNDTIVMKFFLHISKDAQEERLQAREQKIEKAWKLSAGDWKERERWDDYQRAYEDALSQCSTADAPWHIVPANRKWFRNLAIAEALVARLQRERAAWQRALEAMSTARLAELQAYRAGKR